jgi:uncharacterized protein (DUF1697 family)
MAERWVGLLRGINVGGKNRLPMKDLVAAFEASGAREVSTYIQSGNVLFGGSASVAAKLASKVERTLSELHGVRSPVIVRSLAALTAARAADPFADDDPAGAHRHLMLLASAPTKQQLAALDPNRSPGDRYRVVGDVVYLHLPNGVATSKLTNAYFDAKLATVSTVRNLRTIDALIERGGAG